MLSRTHRLRSKDVRYLTKKRQYFGKWLFGFFYEKQYPNRTFHQCSFHVTIKLSKQAVKRNLIKRLIMNHLRDIRIIPLAIGNQFYKIFIVLNKNELLYLQNLLVKPTILRKEVSEYLLKEFKTSFTSFHTFLCSKK